MKNHIFRALTEKSFLYLWLGEIFTQISINLLNFFLILVGYNLTHSNTAVSGIVISFTLPAIFFGTFAGAFVDRWNKKSVLLVTNVVRAGLLILLAFSLHNLFLIYFFSFTIAIFTQFFIPAESPVIPLLVHKDHLYSANALFGMALYGSILIAYVLSGPILIALKPTGTALLLALMLIIGAVFIWFIRLTYSKMAEMKREIQKANILRDLKHTLKLVSQTKAVARSVFLLALSQILILIIATIAPGYATSIGLHVEDFSLLFVAPAALGMVVGAVVLIHFFHTHPKERLITVGICLSGLAMVILSHGSLLAAHGFLDILHILVILAFILGFANALVFVPANTIIQEMISEEFRGKIYGFINTMVGVLSLIPIIAVGGLSDLIGVDTVITGIGVFVLLLGAGRSMKFIKL